MTKRPWFADVIAGLTPAVVAMLLNVPLPAYAESVGNGASSMCPNTPAGVQVDATGCPLDSDQDGVPDYLDKCPGTPKGTAVDGSGCSAQISHVSSISDADLKKMASADAKNGNQAELIAVLTELSMRGYPDIQYNLSTLLPYDDTKVATKWLARSAAQGYKPAKDKMKKLRELFISQGAMAPSETDSEMIAELGIDSSDGYVQPKGSTKSNPRGNGWQDMAIQILKDNCPLECDKYKIIWTKEKSLSDADVANNISKTLCVKATNIVRFGSNWHTEYSVLKVDTIDGQYKLTNYPVNPFNSVDFNIDICLHPRF